MADEGPPRKELNDVRADFMCTYVCKTMRIKPDKWTKMIATDELRPIVADFLADDIIKTLVISTNNAGALIPSYEFSPTAKGKVIYFVRKKPGQLPKDTIRDALSFGSISARPITDLSILVDEVFVPVLTNPLNNAGWPDVVIKDIDSQLQNLRNNIAEVRGNINNNTILPLPITIKQVMADAGEILGGHLEACSIKVRSSLEEIVMKWSNTIEEVLGDNSQRIFDDMSDPMPEHEVAFWQGRLRNLENIYDQLRDERIRTIASILERLDSVYFSTFRVTFRNVVQSLHEARDVTLYLTPLAQSCETFAVTDFEEARPQLKSLMNQMCLLWGNSKYYCTNNRMVHLFRLLHNLFIDAVRTAFDPTSAFQTEVVESLIEIERIIESLEYYKKVHAQFRSTLPEFINQATGNNPPIWSFKPAEIYGLLDRFIGRLVDMRSIFETANEFAKLERVVIGGIKGRQINRELQQIAEDFAVLYREWANIGGKYDLLDVSPKLEHFDLAKRNFDARADELERKLATQFDLAFEKCNTTTQLTTLIQILGTIMHRPVIMGELKPRYDDVIRAFARELELVKRTFDRGLHNIETLGVNALPIDPGQAPVTGVLKWIKKLRARLLLPASNFPYLDYDVFDNDRGRDVMLQNNHMLRLLGEFESETMNKWNIDVSKRIPELLRMNLLSRVDPLMLAENFHDDMAAALRETRTNKLMEMENIPEIALRLSDREDELHLLGVKLSRIVEWYNAVSQKTVKCESDILAKEKAMLDAKIEPAIRSMTWEKYDAAYVDEMYALVKDYYDRVMKAQANVRRIVASIESWGSVPLFPRKDNNNEALLDILTRDVALESRLKKCLVSKRLIDKIVLDENYRLFFNIPFSCPCSSGSDTEDDEFDDDRPQMNSDGIVSKAAQHDSREDLAKLREEFHTSVVIDGWQGVLYRPYQEYVDELVGKAIMDGIATSIKYIKFEIENRLEHNAPIFEVRFELQPPNAIFIPNLDTSSGTGFMALIDEIIVDIYSMCDMIPRIAQPPPSERRLTIQYDENGDEIPTAGPEVYIATYESILRNNKEIEDMRDDIVRHTKKTAAKAIKYVTKYDIYQYLWTIDRDVHLKQFLKYGRGLTEDELAQMSGTEEFKVKEVKPSLDMFRDAMAKYHKLSLEVQQIEEFADIDIWMRLRIKGFKYTLLNELSSWGLLFKYYLRDQVTDKLQELEEFCEEAFKLMGQELDKDDLKALLQVMAILNKIEERSLETDRMFDPLKDIAQMLKEYKFEFDNKIYTQFADLPDTWNKVKKIALNMKAVIAPIQAYQVDLIGKRVLLFEARTRLYRVHFRNQSFFSTNCPDVYTMLDKTHNDICEMEDTFESLKTSTVLFELPLPDNSSLVKCRRELKLVKELWDFVIIVRSCIEDWKDTPWNKIDVEEIDGECKKIGKEMRVMDKDLRGWDPFLHTENSMKNLMTSLRAITELQNPAIRDRHWAELMDTTHVKIEITEDTTLANLVDLNLHNFEEDIKNIVDKSVKEGAMEKVLRDLEVTWKDMSFEYDKHMRTGKQLLKVTEETTEVLEDHQGQLQNMLSSKYIPHFLTEVSHWQELLGNADAVITAWMEVQRKWQYLESIFIGSKDIRNQLPEDSKRFDTIDSEFKQLLATVENESNIVLVTNRKGLLDKLEELQAMLIMCEKALNDYLETKRLAYPRFYFISSSDLLDILSNGNQPDLVCRHLTKLYDSMAKLTLSGTSASEMISKEQEVIAFKSKCDCSGQVEIWLNRVTDAMKVTLHASFATAVISYEENPRDKWIFMFPAQPALCTTQIWWTNETNAAFAILEEGYENALKDYQRKQISQLNALIVLLLGNLSPNDRQKIMTVCTIDVHSRDVVAKMIAQRIDNALAFQWQCQLRHRWDKRFNDCFANICDAQFRYDFEYLGNTPRLVITPLTDRCYITLTQSLHLVMGGAPAGPAGTGKTETTKDLGKGLGVMVYVFNCSEQMDYKSCGNIYKGLAQTGAWGCFDEFNRIAVEVLSVVAVQVKSILDAIKMRKTMFNFMGEVIRLIPTVGMFITMNPGYAGRTELPENLKALFRPCAMCVPDFALISEIMLVAEGFQEARQLSRKFITLYTLCKELLSKQDHYDWGLRAIKSVLVVAGALKRSDRDRPEDQVLMRALRDFNIPKIVTEDVPIFMGLIGDLFPNLDVPRKRDQDFENIIKKSALDLKLQPEKGFVLKVVQLEELFAVRHSVFVVGFAGTGKSEVWKTLNRTYFNQKRKPFFNDLNPKAVTNDELFGIINPATREWKDGLFSVIMRDQANMPGDGPKWIVLDGDIDPMWIESLNTLMDDNKILTLASNERIALTKQMRLLFEIGGLKTATPATVSRAGILYINPQDLGWNPFVASWIDTRPILERPILTVLFEKYVPPLLEIMKHKLKKITPISEIAMIQMTCHLLDCLYTPANLPNDCPKEWYEIYFAFATIWGFGSALFQDQIIDWRNEFNKWWLNEFKTVKFPVSGGTVFNYYIDPETKVFMPWTKLVPSYELDPDIPLQSALVNTAETTRLRYFMDILIEKKHPVMLVGGSGSGKSVIVSDKLNALSLSYAITNVPFNFYTTSMVLQQVLEKPLEKKAGRVFGPPGNKRMIYFIDDMNMPEVDTYGTVQPHTLVRQFMDYQHWYDRTKLSLKDIHNCQFISCMNPTAGSFTIDTRLQRHFATFAVSFPGADAMFTIYYSIMSQHVGNVANKFHPKMVDICDPLIKTAIALHQKMNVTFLPTAVKFHYNFNMRDLANIFSGMMFANGDCCPTPNMLVRLYVHEAYRVYGDKLVSFEDLDTFNKMVLDIVRKGVETCNEVVVFEKPVIFFHYADGLSDPKYMPARTWKGLNTTLEEAQSSYNDVIGAMNLVLFEDAMSHICRISRILENDRGYALLIGVGGSGKQSLTRLAAYISALDVFQTQLRKGFSAADLRLDLALLYMKAGVKNQPCCYLMTDSQVAEEQFLVLINDLLASGEIPDLFAPDEIENIVNAVRNEVKQAGMLDSKENCWKFFIDKVRRMLKIVLCFSPVGSTLRIRGRKFPALVNCTAIDWFHEWPQNALESVSNRFLAEIEVLPEELTFSVAQFMAYVHGTVNHMSQVYLQNERRYNYTTPKSYLELISLYSKLLNEKHAELKDRIVRLETGLIKLADCSAQVDGLQEQLKVQEVILNVKKGEADKQHAIVSAENEKVGKEKSIAAEKEKNVRIIEEEVSIKSKLCQEDLKKAEPIMMAAIAALDTLDKNNLTELKSFGSPAPAVVDVAAAVLVLMCKGKIPKDRSWKACKGMMGNVGQFLDNLKNYDKKNIPAEVIKALMPYLEKPDFEPDIIRGKSGAAAGLCEWVINIHKFYEVYLIVGPKERALNAAEAELRSAQNVLEELNVRLGELQETLNVLQAKLDHAAGEKAACQAEADKTEFTIQLAHRLVDGLASEKIRWRQSVVNLKEQIKLLPGDILLISCFISYVGCFTRRYRLELQNKLWLPTFKTITPIIPVGENADPLEMICDDAQIAFWNNEGLPSDRMSAENATILTNSARWPLMIDPQLQGIKWIKQKYGNKLVVIRLSRRTYLDEIEKAVSKGSTVLIENIDESVDAVLDPLLGRQLIKKGKCVKMGDREVDYNPKFRLILHTKLANPHYKPEMQAQTTLINFTVTRDGLEEQLLGEVVKAERPDLEKLKSDLTTQQNQFKITLKNLEDDLLFRLSNAGENVLEDPTLVLNLEKTKKTAAEIEVKVREAKITSKQIDEAREYYRVAAERASIIYFILNDLNKINRIYQFSLKAFTVVFHSAIKVTPPAESLHQRVLNLVDTITFEVFMYTCRALFERDKLILMAQIAIQVLLQAKLIEPTDLDFLLRFPYLPNCYSPVDFIANVGYGGIKALSNMDVFAGLDKDIEGYQKRWRNYAELENPENEKLPGEWKNKTSVQRLCIIRCLRPDRMTYAMRAFVEEELGSKYVTARMLSFEQTFVETSNVTHTFFTLSAGVNPLKDVEQLGLKMKFSGSNGNFHNVSLGQGQEVVAEAAIDLAAAKGHWVILQNIHLVARWLPTLEKKIESTLEHSHPDYRLYVSAEPAASPEYHILPQGVLESAIKITNEPPTGMMANLHKSLDNFTQETLEMCSKEAEFKAILFALCYFHACVAERRKFGPQGWNRSYPFNFGDLTISVYVLYNYLEANTKVPWEDLRYLFGEIMYGGHITDDWDRRLCATFLEEYMQPELVEGDLFFAAGFQCPPNTDYVGYHRYIDEAMPPESPVLYGLHSNAEIGVLTTLSEQMFKTIFELQPRESGDSSGGGGMSKDDISKQIIEDIVDKIPDEFNLIEIMARVEDRTPYIIVAFQECDRMNMLMREIKRSLNELYAGLKGELTITPDMERLDACLQFDVVPPKWTVLAYPSLLGLQSWFADLILRLGELTSWASDFQLPSSVWLAGFFNPQSFLTAIMQQTARRNGWPLDRMCLNCDVTKKQKNDFTSPPREGAYVNGLFMEGARWDMTMGTIADSKLKELFPAMPVFYIKAVTQDKQDVKNVYECPVYKIRMRGPTFVWTFNLKTKEKAAKWTLAGVCLLLQV